MRRRSSGSAAEEEGDDSASNADLILTSEGAGARSKSEDTTSTRDSTSSQATSRQSNSHNSSHELDRRKSTDQRPSTARSRIQSSTNWKTAGSRNGQIEKDRSVESAMITVPSKEAIAVNRMPEPRQNVRRPRFRSPWSCSPLTLVTTTIATLCLVAIIHSFVSRQLDTKGCRMSYMRPSFAKLSDFDTEHTRFASKYSVFLYREGMVDEDTKV